MDVGSRASEIESEVKESLSFQDTGKMSNVTVDAVLCDVERTL